MTVRLAAFALFSVDFRKKFRNVVDFSRRGALPNRENVYNEGKFFVFPRFRSIAVRLPFDFRSVCFVGRAARESKSGRIEGRRERARRERAPEPALTLRSDATCVVGSAK